MGHLGAKPVTFLVVLPFMQVIVFFAVITFALATVGTSETIGASAIFGICGKSRLGIALITTVAEL